MRLMGLTAALLLAMAACSPVKTEAAKGAAVSLADAPRHGESGLPVVPLTVTRDKTVHKFKVEVASTGAEQEKGLMFRTAMGADEGMIFPMNPARPASFWMKNTVIPLDLVFIGPDHRVLNIAANAEPYSLTPIPSAGPVIAVLELIGGRAEQLGIGKGDVVGW